ncbi:MAG: importin-alpha export receptor [Piccolia ochrophora]|nr:MAG: importin-alpha export receptor [Piccolia ochrophora]
MAANLQAIAQLLEATLDPKQNKQAEIALRQEERKPGFSLLLLQVIAADSYSYTTRLASALCFKNFIRRNWTDEEGVHKLPANEVASIKQELIGLMISQPQGIQSQLGDAASIIADSDFWKRWDTLVDDLVSRLTPDNAVVNNGVLQVAHSIFKRWRPLFRSDDLFTEINHVLERFGPAFLTLLENTDKLIEQNSNDRASLQQLFSTLNLIIKLFYDLSSQDLPPMFEDNLPAITSLLHKYLTYDNPLLHSQDEEAGSLEFVKAGICEALVLYVQKYEDAIAPFLGQFITSSWNLLTTIGPETKYDILVSKALHFLTAIAHVQQHAQNFNDEQVLGQVIENVILPNINLRDSDLELFEDEPIEFIRRDLEGSDSDTRRRAATDFLRQLMEQFEKRVTDVVSRYIDHFIAEFSQNPRESWKSKDAAVYLFSAIAAKGVMTASQGVKSTNALVDVVDFFQKNIASDLAAESGTEPILKVDAIKYLYTFRSQLNKSQWHAAFPLLIQHLTSPHYVVYTYAAITLERILFLTTDSREPVFSKSDVAPMSGDLLEHLFQLIQKDPAPPKVQENEFLMRCVMRVLIVIKDAIVPISDKVVNHLVNITLVVSSNPSNPRFYYYHFEAIGAVIRFAAPTEPGKYEQRLFEPLAAVLQKEIQEFIPYVFQLLAALLEVNAAATLPDYYRSLIPPVLMPNLWESKGNVPALVRFLLAVIPRGATILAAENQLQPILGIFQKLLSSKANEAYGFDLIEGVISSFPITALQPYWVPMLNIMLMRLQNSKTETFSLRFVKFYHFLSARDQHGLGADFVVNIAEQVQQGQVTIRYYASVISFTKTLADSNAFVDKYKKGWAYTCEALLKLLQDAPLPSKVDDTIPDQDVDDLSFGVGFTQLNTCRIAPKDPWPEITDVNTMVGDYLRSADARHNGRIRTLIQERLSNEAGTALSAYMQGQS